MNTKICTKCGQEKPIEEFPWHKRRQKPCSICKPCVHIRTKRWRDDNIVSNMKIDLLRHAEKRAQKRGRVFELDLQWIEDQLLDGVCQRSGIPIVYERNNPWAPSIDRIDSSGGYTKTNSQIVCAIYNFAKNEFSDEDVMLVAEALVNNQKST